MRAECCCRYFYIVTATPYHQGRTAAVRPSPWVCCQVAWVARSSDLVTWEDGQSTQIATRAFAYFASQYYQL